MKTLMVIAIGLMGTAALAESGLCKGSSEDQEIEITFHDAEVPQGALPLSNYSIRVTDKTSGELIGGSTFQNSPLVYGRGITGVTRTETFETAKIIFDGARGVAMYTLTMDQQPRQIPLDCQGQ
ncbi:MAG: hypothetical protein AB7N80_05135 [Bdellovibrionales bacterium]